MSTNTVNIPLNTTLHGAFAQIAGQNDVINGPGRFAPSVFVMQTGDSAIVNADVTGTGTFATALGSNLEFGGSVGRHQTVDLALNATITIDKPHEFKGTIGTIAGTAPQEGPFGEFVDLVGLSKADGYTLRNDLLTITAGGKPIDTVRLAPGTSFQQVVLDAGNVYLCNGFGIDRIPGGAGAGVVLPQH